MHDSFSVGLLIGRLNVHRKNVCPCDSCTLGRLRAYSKDLSYPPVFSLTYGGECNDDCFRCRFASTTTICRRSRSSGLQARRISAYPTQTRLFKFADSRYLYALLVVFSSGGLPISKTASVISYFTILSGGRKNLNKVSEKRCCYSTDVCIIAVIISISHEPS